jgi:lysyl-tRNA synthetase class 2
VFDSEFEQNLFHLRREKLKEIENLGQAAYPNRFPAAQNEFATTLEEVRAQWGEKTAEALEAERPQVTVAGRILAIRAQGQGRLCHAAAGGPAAADLRAPRCGGRAGLRAVQAA